MKWSDLTRCQSDALGFSTTNKVQIGGEGSASAIDIGLGSGGMGCDGGTDCMAVCQALCCITKGCTIAMVHKVTDSECQISCDIYEETESRYYCYMYASADKRSKSSVTSSCYTYPNAPTYDRCLTVAKDSGFGWDQSTFDYLKSLQTCSRMVSSDTIEKYPSAQEINDTIKEKIKQKTGNFKSKLKKAVKKAGGKKAYMKKLVRKLERAEKNM